MLPLFVTFTYIKELPHSLVVQPAQNVANIWEFKAFEASGTSRAVMQEESFTWISLLNSLSLTAP